MGAQHTHTHTNTHTANTTHIYFTNNNIAYHIMDPAYNIHNPRHIRNILHIVKNNKKTVHLYMRTVSYLASPIPSTTHFIFMTVRTYFTSRQVKVMILFCQLPFLLTETCGKILFFPFSDLKKQRHLTLAASFFKN
jgi:hypothetical protein